LAALAEAEAAEAEYVAALAREKAIQKQREEEERRNVELQKHREGTMLRRLLLADAVYSQNSAQYIADDFYSDYPSAHHEYYKYSAFEPEVALFDELEGRRAVIRRHREEEVAKRRRLRILRQQQQEREEAVAAARHTQQLQVKLRDQLSASSVDDVQQVLGLLFGGQATVRKESLQEKHVSFNGHSFNSPLSNSLFLIQPQANPVARDQGCGSHCNPRRRPVNNEEDDVEQFLSVIFGGQSDTAHCPCVHKQSGREKAVCHCAPLLRISGPHCRSFKAQGPHTCHAQYQAQRQPTVSRSPAQKPQATTSAPAPVPVVSSLKDQLQSRLSHESESEVRDTFQDVLHSILGPAATLERKERVENKSNDAPTVTGSSSSGLSLKEQLEARLLKDPNVEVHDTIQAILTSLMTPQATRGTSSCSKDVKAQTKAPAPAPSSANEGKGKGKAVWFDIPTTAPSPTSKDVVDSMNTVHTIQAAFSALSNEFAFPTHLDFTPLSSAPSSPHASDSESLSTSQLAYTSTNAPVRYYEQALSGLLSQLDAVESWGNEEVRKERKVIVARVEAALEEVEREVQNRFVQRQARDVGSESVEVKEKGIEETVQSNEAAVTELVEVVAATSTAPVGEAAGVAEAIDGVAGDVSAPAEKQSKNVQETATIIEPTPSVPSDEKSDEHSEETLSPVDETPVFASTSSISEAFTSTSEGREDTNPIAPVDSVNRDAHDRVEATTLDTKPSYRLVSQTPGVSDAVAEPASPKASTSRAESPVDTFLLPATTDLPVSLKRSAVNEEELVIIDKEHEEVSDGENWSEVDA